MAPSVRNDYVVLTARHMRSQAQLLFTGFIASLPLVVFAASDGAGAFVRLGIPMIILAFSLAGLWVVRRRVTELTAPGTARTMIGRAGKLCIIVAGIGGLWALLSWKAASPETRIYYPAIMSLGALTLGYCLTAVRTVGLSALLVALLPICITLLMTGEPMNGALAGGMLIAIGFQMVMMKRHEDLLLMLVEERHRSRELARVDPLTGLANRRALMEDFEGFADAETELRLLVVDIDRFKAINDRFGHDMGDRVLRHFAVLLNSFAHGPIKAARLGGEEFALLGPRSLLDRGAACRLLDEIRKANMPHGLPLTASVGVAEERIVDPSDWSRLYGRADRALYAAKAQGRDCAMAAGREPLREEFAAGSYRDRFVAAGA